MGYKLLVDSGVRTFVGTALTGRKTSGAQYRLISGDGIIPEERLEDYLVRGLVDFDDVNYDEHADLLYKLAAEMVKHIQSYLPNEEDVRNILHYHPTQSVTIIHSPMQARDE